MWNVRRHSTWPAQCAWTGVCEVKFSSLQRALGLRLQPRKLPRRHSHSHKSHLRDSLPPRLSVRLGCEFPNLGVHTSTCTALFEQLFVMRGYRYHVNCASVCPVLCPGKKNQTDRHRRLLHSRASWFNKFALVPELHHPPTVLTMIMPSSRQACLTTHCKAVQPCCVHSASPTQSHFAWNKIEQETCLDKWPVG